MFTKLGVLGSAMAFALTTTTPVFAGTAEVIHWWTSGGEAAALKILVEAYEKTGNTWKDNPVAGGEAARMVARTRILGGDPPTSMQWQVGAPLMALAEEGQLNDIDAVAQGLGQAAAQGDCRQCQVQRQIRQRADGYSWP